MKKNEKMKKQKSALVGVIISIFAENPFKAYNYKQIGHKIGIKDKASRDLLLNILNELIANDDINEIKRGKYMLNPNKIQEFANKKKYITGTVDMKKTGKAYIISDDGGDDIFIASNNVGHALHNDKVKVFLFPKRKNHKTEGQIVEVLERVKDTYVGILELNKNFGFVVTDNQTMPYDIFIPKSKINKAVDGQKVMVKIVEWPDKSNNPFGEITEVLGNPGDNDVEMNSILADYGFPLSFPKNVENDAGKIPTVISLSEIIIFPSISLSSIAFIRIALLT